ncbi:sporulation protein YqfD [Clostridium vincentii]|uniref:Putative stage IV sporulation protein YqfD n=1 Tax=Clostridium vincentii TaxID=52704 RepID=A0A2T0BJ75_9CLOT|nr:sporulation protein YqfD [Clostridium vincentii]PRR83920.1 putative stage IV sporulation protein YqfD [Clostridium vincentii]
MRFLEKFKIGRITLEVSAPVPEKFLNLLWNKGVRIKYVNRININTLSLEIGYGEYKEVEKAAKKCKAKIRIVSRDGLIFLIIRVKRKISLLAGVLVFLGGLYLLSTHLWAIEITTKQNVAPFEIRKQLADLGIKPGLSKNNINVYTLEKKIEDVNSNILWIRARIEGSTLKVVIEEKVAPPKIIKVDTVGDCVAKMDGEIKRIYIKSGTSNVAPGDMIKEGDVLIKGIEGKEGGEYSVDATGTVIANTFYEKEMEIKTSGTKLEKTGEKDNDIYLEFFNKKIYLKKAINNFKYYDTIDNKKGFINQVTYFEREKNEIKINQEEAVVDATVQLEESLSKALSNDVKISNKEVHVEDIGDGVIRIKVMFLVEQNIAG